jgi:hypothetical protein
MIMKSFAMLRSAPIEPDTGETKYFVDGVRVSKDEYIKLTDNCARQDTFHTYRFAGRWHMRSVCYA